MARIESHELRQLASETGLDEEALLLALVAWARRWARPLVSHFQVGALALGGSGRLYFGANIEWLGLPLNETVHAEQAAILHAWVGGETELRAVVASSAPCGLCRQFMLELPEPRPRVLALGHPLDSLDAYLPSHFGPTELGRAPQLLRTSAQGLALLDEHEANPLVGMALAAADRSSAPYTGSLAGVAVSLADGQRFAAGVIESVAYNPTLGPMQAALVAVHLQGGRIEDVREAVLVEVEGAPVSHSESAQRILASVVPGIVLQRFAARSGK